VPIALFLYHYARFTLRRSSFRYFLFDFVEAVILSSNCFKTETVADIFQEEIGGTISVPTLQEYRKKRTIVQENSFDKFTLRPQITNLGIITNIELPTESYIFRRDNRQALDNSNKWILIFD